MDSTGEGPPTGIDPEYGRVFDRRLDLLVEASPDDASRQHGTHVASILFGQDNGGYAGLAPKCRGIVIPIFQQKAGGGVYCSQIDLAHGVALALDGAPGSP